MLATLVPDIITPITAPELLEALRVQYFQNFDGELNPAACAVFCAQSALETGNWRSIHCYNIGNIKAASAYDGLYCRYRCSEIIQGLEKWFDPPSQQCNFRAYEDLDSAVLDYLTFLQNRTRFVPAWAAAVAGDPGAFVRALKAGGYFTATEEPYERAVVWLQRKFLAMISPEVEPPPHEDHEWERLRGVVAANQFDVSSDDRAVLVPDA